LNRNRIRFTSLATRLSFWVALLGVLIFSVVLGSNYYLTRDLLKDYIEELATQAVSSSQHEIETIFNTVATGAESLAMLAANTDLTEIQIHTSIKNLITTHPNIYGMTVALEPYVLRQNLGEFSPYYYRNRTRNQLDYADLAAPKYRYLEKDWYTTPKNLGTSAWAEPYWDFDGGNVWMTTYSVPIRTKKDGAFAGIATADIELDWLKGVVNDISILDSGYGLIVSQSNIVIAHSNKSLYMKPLSEVLPDSVDLSSWQQHLSKSYSGDSFYYKKLPCIDDNGDCWAVIESIGDTGWKIVIMIPDQELRDDINTLTLKVAGFAIGGMALLVLVIVMVIRYLTRPLEQLAIATRSIGTGKLDADLPIPVREDEIGLLTREFSSMRDSLKHYIAELTETTAQKQKLESEIQIAHDIQMSMVNGGGNASIEHTEYQVYAYLLPARSVGGDLYYFEQQGNQLHFIIGDVSDKGVPAALFMAKAVTLYTSSMKAGLSPGTIFTRMNDALYQNNDTCMFVTALCGTLYLDSGKLVMANAGHMYPIQHGAVHDNLVLDGGGPLGLMPDIEYKDIQLKLDQGSRLLMYTDGISEAYNINHEHYQEERLLEFIGRSVAHSATTLGEAVLADLEDFVSDAEQSDDITLMVIQYGPSERYRITLQSNSGEVERLFTFIHQSLENDKHHIASEEFINDIKLVAEEWLANIVNHAYHEEHSGTLDIALRIDDKEITIVFKDSAAAFNPLTDYDDTGQRDHSEGGRGLSIIRSLTDKQHYTRENGHNVFTLTKYYNPASSK
jgi:sigma-B regulation protein RsbU (phosphoserine phosphatase)